jgi:hypothetical protein
LEIGDLRGWLLFTVPCPLVVQAGEADLGFGGAGLHPALRVVAEEALEPVFVSGDSGVAAFPIDEGEGVDGRYVLAYSFDVGVLEAGVGLGDAELPRLGVDGLGVEAALEFLFDEGAEFGVEVEHEERDET